MTDNTYQPCGPCRRSYELKYEQPLYSMSYMPVRHTPKDHTRWPRFSFICAVKPIISYLSFLNLLRELKPPGPPLPLPPALRGPCANISRDCGRIFCSLSTEKASSLSCLSPSARDKTGSRYLYFEIRVVEFSIFIIARILGEICLKHLTKDRLELKTRSLLVTSTLYWIYALWKRLF